jgi:hypothetical protein
MIRRLLPALAGLLLGLFTPLSQAQTVVCHLTYGGDTQVVESAATASPYTGSPTAIGSFFLFRIVFIREPADLARINLYVHADLDEAPMPLQHASYPYPVRNQKRYGFTGLQRIYEPKRESELQYWCELRKAARP